MSCADVVFGKDRAPPVRPSQPPSRTKRPTAADASHRQPRPDATRRPATGPHYTNWPRPILKLV
jgi:hypothetical protein